MSKERLEELKKMRLLYEVCFVDEYASAIDDVTADFDLLIKRVQELEELEQEYIELNNDFTKLALENKRYRKKIEVALDISKKGSRDDIRVSNMQYVLNEALEGIVNE